MSQPGPIFCAMCSDGFEFPTLNFRRPDELSDFHIATLLELVSDGWTVQGLTSDRVTQLRAELYRAIDNPCDATWEAVYGLKLWKPGLDIPAVLWAIVLQYTAYSVQEHKLGEPWPAVPTGGQIFLALAELLGVSSVSTQF